MFADFFHPKIEEHHKLNNREERKRVVIVKLN